MVILLIRKINTNQYYCFLYFLTRIPEKNQWINSTQMYIAETFSMRTVFFIFLSCVLLNSATELHQLFKLPSLIAHYLHHRQEDKSITFFDFLRIHYSENHPLDNDDEEDNQLPFKSDGTICHIDTMPSTIKEAGEKSFIFLPGKPTCGFREENLSQRSLSIFRPPRLS
jgi:hypothetical protein